MSDVINLIQRAESAETSPQFSPYSKVIVNISDEEQKSAGNNTGRTVEIDNPLFGSQVPSKLLARIRGFRYQPGKASGALLDPAAEIGDAISVGDLYFGMYSRSRDFGRLMKADVEAPQDEEINHEYKFESPTERKFRREVSGLSASLKITESAITSEVTRAKSAENTLSSRITQNATAITAKVSSTGGSNSSFAWSLTADGFKLVSNKKTVLNATSSGIAVNGEINSTTGKIGGFTIASSSLYNGMTSINDTANNGVFVGTSGIACGKGAFKVTSSGAVTASKLTITGGSITLGSAFKVTSTGAVTASNLTLTGGSIKLGSNFSVNSSGNVTANNMTLTGTLNIGGSTITAAALRSGAQSAYSNSGTWNSTSTTVNNNGGYWNGGASYGYSYNAATINGTTSYPSFFRCGNFQCSSIFVVGKGGLSFSTINIGGVDRNVVTWY